jgi:hypothetical protein
MLDRGPYLADQSSITSTERSDEHRSCIKGWLEVNAEKQQQLSIGRKYSGNTKVWRVMLRWLSNRRSNSFVQRWVTRFCGIGVLPEQV